VEAPQVVERSPIVRFEIHILVKVIAPVSKAITTRINRGVRATGMRQECTNVASDRPAPPTGLCWWNGYHAVAMWHLGEFSSSPAIPIGGIAFAKAFSEGSLIFQGENILPRFGMRP
jgi:hypothetical protein